jgi:hypothetical protein
MSEAEALETAAVASVSDLGFDPAHWGQRPVRAPHHSASDVALIGGGARPRPGEISLAHNGVLFLDELEEFQDWGPIGADAKPCPKRKGQTFRQFLEALQRQDYKVVHRELRACDFGAPTIRKRLFLIARRDGCPLPGQSRLTATRTRRRSSAASSSPGAPPPSVSTGASPARRSSSASGRWLRTPCGDEADKEAVLFCVSGERMQTLLGFHRTAD